MKAHYQHSNPYQAINLDDDDHADRQIYDKGPMDEPVTLKT